MGLSHAPGIWCSLWTDGTRIEFWVGQCDGVWELFVGVKKKEDYTLWVQMEPNLGGRQLSYFFFFS